MDPIVPQNDIPSDSQPSPLKYCPHCNRDLPATTEYWHRARARKDGLLWCCKTCKSKQAKAQADRDPDFHKKKWQKELAKSPEEQAQRRARQAENVRQLRARRRQPYLCTACLLRPVEPGHLCEVCRERQAQWCEKHPDYVRARNKRLQDNLRNEILAAYGGKCACCGEICPEFLAVDHIHNNGAEHRRSLGMGAGSHFYIWLRQNNFPQEEFQLLCHNCNHAKHVYGICPHQRVDS